MNNTRDVDDDLMLIDLYDKTREQGNAESSYIGESIIAGIAAKSVFGESPKAEGKVKGKSFVHRFDNPDYELTDSDIAHGNEVKRRRAALIEYKKHNENKSLSHGIEVQGKKVGDDLFVKESRFDVKNKTGRRGNIRALKKIKDQVFPGLKSKGFRNRMMNRQVMHEKLGDVGTNTFHYQKNSSSPVTLVQDNIDIQLGDANVTKTGMRNAMNEVMEGARKNGVEPRDMHLNNIGFKAGGNVVNELEGQTGYSVDIVDRGHNPRILDVGHSKINDYKGLVNDSKLKKALKKKSITSVINKKLLKRMAKNAGKKLPMVLAGMTAFDMFNSDSMAQAAQVAEESYSPVERMGNAELPSMEMAKRAAWNEANKRSK